FFNSPEEVVEEKAALIDALVPEGTLVLYADDNRAPDMRRRAVGKHIVTFGFQPEVDVRAQNFSVIYEEGLSHMPVGIEADVTAGGVSVPVQVVGTAGAHTLLPALAAVAVGRVLGKDLADCIQGLGRYVPPPGRMHLLRGIKNSTVIDDTYNSSPAAVEAAIDTLVLVAPNGRKIAALGDMLELGRHSVDEHRKIGAYAAGKVDLLVTVGFRARDIAQGALDAGLDEKNILQFEDSDKAGEELAALVNEGDVVLVKGSQSVRMEHAVKELMANPERAHELLVRQDMEWTKR
ncbi:MAG TPA: cyanophycin synthetase, partial [Candidatus Paceibacterota bacterium]|nr:cyanophycin synthetase [Candidatus Paceibacterota bacterium]